MRVCEQYEDMISAFIDGVLSEEDRKTLAEHMAGCPDCQAYFDQQIAIHDALLSDAAQNGIEAPAGFAAEVMARVREQVRPRRAAVHWRRWAALAACCVLAAAGFWTAYAPPGALSGGVSADEAAVETTTAGRDAAAPEFPGAVRCSPDPGAVPAEDEPAEEPAAPAENDTTLSGGTALSAAPPPVENKSDAGTGAPPVKDEDTIQDSAPEAPAGTVPEAAAGSAPDAGTMDGSQEAFSIPAPAADLQAADIPEEDGETDGDTDAFRRVMTADGPTVRAWVEEQGLSWTEGGYYELSAAEYTQLRDALTEAGEDFSERTPDGADSEGYLLITEESSETE